MRSFTKVKFWLLLMVMGLAITSNTTLAQNKDIYGSITSTTSYVSGVPSQALGFNITYTSPSFDWARKVTMTFPAGLTIVSAPNLGSKPAVISGQTVSWGDAASGWVFQSSNVNTNFTVTVSVSGSVTGNQAVSYLVNGDGSSFGAPQPWNFSGNATISQAIPKLTITPDVLDLGEWPVGGWQEDAVLELSNDATGTVNVTASELDDQDNVFGLTNPALPLNLIGGGASAYVGVHFDGTGVPAGAYTSTYVATWGAGKSVTTADISATAYIAPVGDIVENPYIVSLPYASAGNSTAFPMRSNYNIPGTLTNGKDVVYKFTLTEDKEVDVAITNATMTPKMAIYSAATPTRLNSLFSAGATANNLPLFAGTYYLVVAAEADDAAMTYDIAISATQMPGAICPNMESPVDGAIQIPSNGITLGWTYGAYTEEYQLMFGTTYPPTQELVAWTATNGATTGSYSLPNLNPSMQYFWQVNVRNNNFTSTCNVWGFTTTLTPPSNLTATVVEINPDQYNVRLNWTASAKSLLGYNVYRDNVKINASLVTTNTYTDLNLAYNMNPCYAYQVEAIFDEGVSAKSNVATACITGTGTVDGFVTELLTGNPIPGAEVKLISTTGGATYTLTTDIVGRYGADVYEGTYNYNVSADGFIGETRNNVSVAYNTTRVENFQLDEFPYPVGTVVATELNDNTVQVDWSGNGGGGIAQWLSYDDGINVDAIGGPAAFTWAIKFDPAQLVDYPGCKVAKFQFYAYNGDPVQFVVMEGASGSVIYTQNISGLTVGAWNEVALTTPVAFDNTQALWVGFNTTLGGNYPASCGATVNIPNSDLITLDGSTWEHLSDYGLPYSWNLRAFVTDANGKSFSMNTISLPEYKKNDNTSFDITHNGSLGNSSLPTTVNGNDKDLMGYNVYRQVCDESTPMQFLGMTLDMQFTDNTWGVVTWGTYKWAVEAIYTNNVSEVVYSNCLDKDMEAVVGVEVTTNSGDAPEGCQVVFTNTSEPALGLVYELELDATGLATIDPFRKGTYDILVTLAGFADITVTGALVDTDMTFVWQLLELLAPPTDLYVTPTGFATWGGGGAVPFVPFEATFDTQEDFDLWTIVDGGSTTDTWQFVTTYNGSSINGTPFAMADADGAGIGSQSDETMISPVIDGSNADVLILEFDQYYNFLSGEYADVDVYDGSAWVNVLHQVADAGSWASPNHQMIDVTAYANADFQVRFHYYSPGWNWYWAVDNVRVHDNSKNYADDKAFQFFKVWHDGVFSTDTDTTFYQYGDMGEVLVPGETYLAEVATLYSTGLSAKAFYSWTYLPCDSFSAPLTMEANTVGGSDDVLVLWGNTLPLELITLTQGYGDPSNGYFQFYDFGYGVAYDFTQYPDALVNSVNFRHSSWGTMGTWDYLIHIINWDTRTVIATVGPFQTTGNDTWENNIQLGDVATGGATTVAIIMEPQGNSPTDAYPCLDSDDAADPQGSVYGDLADLNGMGSSTIGNFLMDVSIYTANGGKSAAPVVMTNVEAPAATARVANNNTFNANQVVMQQEVANKAKAAAIAIGTAVYRDGAMIAYIPLPDTFYLDMNLEPGYYDYCVATVYTEDAGMHWWTSCPGSLCVNDVLVPEDCLAPENLTAEDLTGDGYTATLNWNAPNGFDPIWLQYDDGVNVDAIGGPTEFSIAAKWNPSQLVDFDGTAITQVKFFPREAGSSFTLKIWKGANGGTLLHEQPVSGITFDAWNTVTLTSPVAIDITQDLYIGYYVVTGGYPAGCGNFTGNPNSDLVSLDGATWEHLGDYGLPYSWNLGAYVEAAKGQVVELPSLVDHATYNSSDATLKVGNLPASPNAVSESTRAFMGYNVYRDGVKVNDELVMETTYADNVGEAGNVCYEVTAVYSVCGESDPSNEACVFVGVGVNEVDNTVAVYPNPATDFVSVEASSNIRSIVITNYMGQVVSTVKSVELTKTTINTSDLSAGVYFVEVETAAGIEKVRIVISE